MTGPVRVPTHNLDAEAAVISAVLLVPTRFYDVTEVVGSGDFYADANRWIWRALEALEVEGSSRDVVTVARWLQAREKIQLVGGTPYLAQIQNSTPDVANIVDHARIVADCAHQRRMVASLQRFAAEGFGDVGDVGKWAQDVEQGVYEAARRKHSSDEDGSLSTAIPSVLDAAQKQSRGDQEPPGIPTGLHALDDRINGLKRAKVYVVAGRPGMGKSAFLGQVGTAIARRLMLVVEISTEQTRDELSRRKLAQEARVAYSAIESGQLHDAGWIALMEAGERLRKLPLSIEFMVAPTISRLRSAIRRALARLRHVHGDLPIGLISVDQLGQLDAGHERGESREAEIARLSRELSWMAGEFDAPMIVAAQLNRGVEQRPDKRPLLSDLRDSGAIEQDAYGVLFPFRPGYYSRDKTGADKGPEPCELIIAKHKNGPGQSVPLVFHGTSMSFDVADDYAPRQAALPHYSDESDRRFP